jgi:hypothetical protein
LIESTYDNDGYNLVWEYSRFYQKGSVLMKKITGIIILNVLLFALVATTAGQASTTTLNGIFSVVFRDGKTAIQSETLYYLVQPNGQYERLTIDPVILSKSGGIEAFNNKQVSVNVDTTSRVPGQPLDVSGISLAPNQSGIASRAVTTGDHIWLNLLCKMSDQVDEPVTPAQVQTMFEAPEVGLNSFFPAASYGKISSLDGETFGWYSVPGTLESYITNPAPTDPIYGLQLVIDCLEDFLAANPSADMNRYLGINILYNDEPGYAYAAGIGGFPYPAELGGVTKNWQITFNPLFALQFPAVIAHEMGHTYGLFHTNNSDYDLNPYDNPFDVMSYLEYGCTPPPLPIPPTPNVLDCNPRHFITYHKDQLGWIDPDKKVTITTDGTTTVNLSSQVLSNAADLRVAYVPTSSIRAYSIEVRRPTDSPFEENVPGPGVVIHEVVAGRFNEQVHLIGGTADETVEQDAVWVTGETFNDFTAGISISVGAATSSGYQVTVTRTGFSSQAEVCPAGFAAEVLFSDDFESGGAKWTTRGLELIIAQPSPVVWTVASNAAPLNGSASLYGFSPNSLSDSVAEMVSDVAIPANAYLRFNHVFGFELDYDGGVVEYSNDSGTTWYPLDYYNVDSGLAYNNTILKDFAALPPLFGRPAFSGISVFSSNSTRFNLSNLTGQNVRFRFRIGTDFFTITPGDFGWSIDDVQVYTCRSTDLIVNGGFEVDTNSDNLPDSWNTNKLARGRVKCNKPGKIVANSGECAFEFRGVGRNNRIVQSINPESVSTGSTLQVNMAVNTRQSTKKIGLVKVKYASGESSKIRVDANGTPSGYELVSASGEISAAPTSIDIQLNYKSSTGKVLIDDVSLLVLTAPAAQNLIPLPAQ